ncbi:PaaX family transcriptional regulator C-terminal domain-containing protein [Salipiger mangrovisoli]|uniref:ArsR family transcriptional regulator n=1 Tax=Salipiger mangrovisoli TaxID=2865933 RepID=A0ABR9X4N7_9RHOB|nr:PaaX family transcriptional regulator C-terminal domain-containing protein [Salipiger mangrovisoli]MBE9638565.1 ArsR family transcriptional regulator [Salipiger mangrovisoli]
MAEVAISDAQERSAESPALAGLAAAEAPRAPAFIVTIYGDVVEPRGGMLWMGTLIDCCARHGLNESLVRTAVSRLVGAGRLEGVRIGRRSYYRLSEAARSEFREAARLLFAPPPVPEDWLLCLSEGLRDIDLPLPWARLAANIALAPNRDDLMPVDGILMRAKQLDGHGDLAVLAADRWSLPEVAGAYGDFLASHGGLRDLLARNVTLSPEVALALRLRLVHDYRHAALSDPRLPRAAYPQDWPAEEARNLFVCAYVGLSKAAEAHVGAEFLSPEGHLAPHNGETERRLFQLRREAAG